MLVEVYCDGAVRSEGKYTLPASACAFAVFINKRLAYQAYRLLGEVTSNEAEYEAIIMTLLYCVAKGYKNPIIYTDSATVSDQINGNVACKSTRLVPLLFTIKKIKQTFSFKITKVPRIDVDIADSLCNEILDQFQGITPNEDLDL